MALILALAAPALAAETAFPPDLTGVLDTARASDGAVYVVGIRDYSRGYLARFEPTSGTVVDLSGNLPESATPSAVTVDNAGALYVAGAAGGFAFAQKLDREGVQQYLSSVPREAVQSSRAISIVVNEAGEALIGGELRYRATSESPAVVHTGFVAKLDARGAVQFEVLGVGAGPATWDPEGNVYVAGAHAILPVTPAAFQTTHDFQACGGTVFVGLPCAYQHVAKLSPDGQRVLYATFLTGDYGAQPAALAVNGQGELTIAGTTNSPNYPTTRGTFQADYQARHQPPPSTGPHPGIFPPAAAGFVTRLNSAGSDLVWSTFFSGTETDSLTGLAVFPDGRIAIAGSAGSPDLPGLTGYPSGCAPWPGREQPFIAVLSPAAASLRSTLVTWNPGRMLVLDQATPRFAVVSPQGYQEYATLADQRDVCIAEPADWTFTSETAPGHLLTIFGIGLGDAPVDFDGAPARRLYASSGQINIQTPGELRTGATATLRIGSSPRIIELPLHLAERRPRVFMGAVPFDLSNRGVPCEGMSLPGSYQPEAYNEDGKRNACGSRAPRGTIVRLTLNGLGTEPPDVTLADLSTARVAGVDYDEAALTWQLRIQVWPEVRENGTDPYIGVTPIVNGVKVPYSPLVLWTAPSQ